MGTILSILAYIVWGIGFLIGLIAGTENIFVIWMAAFLSGVLIHVMAKVYGIFTIVKSLEESVSNIQDTVSKIEMKQYDILMKK